LLNTSNSDSLVHQCAIVKSDYCIRQTYVAVHSWSRWWTNVASMSWVYFFYPLPQNPRRKQCVFGYALLWA